MKFNDSHEKKEPLNFRYRTNSDDKNQTHFINLIINTCVEMSVIERVAS